MHDRYSLHFRPPSDADYRRLCTAVGWGDTMNFGVAARSLAASLCAVTLTEAPDGEVVAMGRVVGDGAMYFYLQDVAVLPSHQGAGPGRRIVETLLAWIRGVADGEVFVGVFATPGSRSLYRDYGFDAQGGLTGMFRVLS